MATILIKRGLEENIDNLSLEYGEIALVYNSEKTAIAMYAGDGLGGKVIVNPDVSGDITGVLTQANGYTDTKISELVNGAPEAMDTLKELADAIAENSDLMTALNAAIGNKVDKADGMSLVSDAEKTVWNSKLDASSTIDCGTF